MALRHPLALSQLVLSLRNVVNSAFTKFMEDQTAGGLLPLWLTCWAVLPHRGATLPCSTDDPPGVGPLVLES